MAGKLIEIRQRCLSTIDPDHETPADFVPILDIMNYMTRYSDLFHHPMEKLIFKKLIERDDSAGPLVATLTLEHKVLGEKGGQLLHSVCNVVNSFEPHDGGLAPECQLKNGSDLLKSASIHLSRELIWSGRSINIVSMETIEPLPRQQSPTEEIANSLSHGIAFLAAVAALPILVLNAVGNSDAAGIVGASVFGATMVLLYLVSMLYHALPAGVVKRVFLILDHSAIYLLIAGTYTPFALGVLRGSWGSSLFGVVWSVALLGVVLKGVFGTR